jgi:hypothetical protein
MKREARLLLGKAVNSLVLSIEHFNRPWDQGRPETVLILLDHSFELLLKAAILHNGGKIRKKRENQTIGFDECIRTSLPLKIINNEQALTLQAINSLRDAAQHYILDISEHLLYFQCQMGLTLFKDLLKGTFQKDISSELPKRVLPISTTPPSDIIAVFETEVDEVKRLISPRKRRMIEATARLRSLAIFDGSIRGEKLQPSQSYLNKLAKRIQQKREWKEIFPGVASINISSDGSGYPVSLRITKREGVPVQLVPEGTPGATVVAIKRVNELDFYNLSLTQLAEKVKLTPPKALAVIQHLQLKKDPDFFKQITIGRVKFNRYSQKAIHKVSEELPKINLDEIWQMYKPRRRPKNGKRDDRI